MAGIDGLFNDKEWVGAWADLMDKACFKPSTLNLDGVNEALEYVVIAHQKKMPCAPSLDETVPPAQEESSVEVVAVKKEPNEKSIIVAASDSPQKIQLDNLYCYVEQMARIEVDGRTCHLKDIFDNALIYMSAASLHFIMRGAADQNLRDALREGLCRLG